MNKMDFLSALEHRLVGLPREDLAERMAFYSEAIDDRLEDGLSEEEAVAQLGSADAIAAQIVGEGPQTQPPRKERRRGALEIVLLILGAPLWISLLAAVFSIVAAVYASVWSVMISLWAVEVSVTVGAVAGVVGAGLFCFTGSFPAGLALLAAGLFCAGLAIFGYFGCVAGTKGLWWLTKKITLWIVGLFVRKDGKK